ncbi:ABC transporter ATP-binding protein [uncultured Clostridium sp.]|uniref:ABC transporter ATP-binding protein n=1 Tax=uncultured Clostridium sp. TaxID=59620 RepID=UPI00260F3F26|nr:ABC transporter ATP-binding protein [uncultured Clostridium sp.]
MKFIEIKNLSKVYGKGAERVDALKDINLTISKGEFIAIIGASGSGKSTLLNIIGGVDSLDKGEILVDNINITKLNERELTLYRLRKVGFVFQNFNLISALTVEENIEMPVLLDEEKLDKDFKKELLKSLNLERKKNKLPEELSGGEKQRVAIGRALSNKPEIILADEPTGNLDSKNSVEVIELLKYSARKYNQTLIIITHDEKIALEADRIIKLKDGKIVGN